MPYVEYDETEAACPQCGSVFRSQEVLEAHIAESHGGPSTKSLPAQAKAVRCSVCDRRFPSVAALQRHNRTAHIT